MQASDRGSIQDGKQGNNQEPKEFIRACPQCRGEGKVPSKRRMSRKARFRYKQQKQQQNEDTPKAKLPVHNFERCLACSGTGLVNVYANPRGKADCCPTERVAIVGGGIGGLALALALTHRCIPVVVYERDSSFHERNQGYGLTMQQATRALRDLGLAAYSRRNEENNDRDDDDADPSWGIVSKRHVVHRSDGTVVGEWGVRVWGRKRQADEEEEEKQADTHPKKEGSAKRHNVHIARQELRRILLEALLEQQDVIHGDSSSIVQWGHRLVSFEEIQTDRNDESKSDAASAQKPCADDEEKKEENPNAKDSSGWRQEGGCVKMTFQVDEPMKSGAPRSSVGGTTKTEFATVLVGADGIRSCVREGKMGSHDTPLRYLNCVVVLGIAPMPKEATTTIPESHQSQATDKVPRNLTNGETVFQTADGTTRMYAMPFSAPGKETARAATLLREEVLNGGNLFIPPEGTQGEVMWQLSFPVEDEEEAKELGRGGASALKAEALRRCGEWHDPIPTILATTPLALISGYPVYDRGTELPDPAVFRARTETTLSRVTLLGDAAHPMSPFKGQGANQALLDAVSLARALSRAIRRVDEAKENNNKAPTKEGEHQEILNQELATFEAEMLSRSASKVKASAEAAHFLHTEMAIAVGNVTRGGAAAATATGSSSARSN